MRHAVFIMVSGLFLLSALTACADQTGDQPTSDPQPASNNETPSQSNEPVEIDMSARENTGLTMAQAVAAAKDDLARRNAVAAEQIEVVSSRTVTWGDGSMGCPEPEMMYTQALVPGYQIHLRHDGSDAYYHGSRSSEPMYCPAERAQAPYKSDDLM